MSDIIITKPTLDDVDTVFRWGEENRELWGDPETKWYSREILKEWIEHPREDILLGARVDGKLAGMCFNNTMKNWAYCSGLYVDKPFRKMGTARKLVDETIIRLKKISVEALVFLVEDKNTEGMKFYRKI